MITFPDRIRRWTFWPMLRKEFIQMRRDRLTLAMMIGIPAIQLALFGYAIQTEVRHLPTLVLDESRTQESRALVHTLINTGNFDLAGVVTGREEMTDRIARGEARAGIIIPPTYSRDLARGLTGTAQVVVDASDPLAANAAMGGAAQAGLVQGRALLAARGVVQPIEIRVGPWYNPTVRSAVFIVPGIIGVLLSITMVIINSIAVVRERERGTLEQLVVTPIGRTSLMLGKTVPFLLVGYVQITVILLLGKLLFDVPVQGSLVLLYLAAFPFIAANLAIGLFLSTLVRTQAQAMQLGFLFLLPNILLSGFMFPREAMPVLAQWIGAALPLTWFLNVLRGILLKGLPLAGVVQDTAILAGFAVFFLVLSIRRFHKTLD